MQFKLLLICFLAVCALSQAIQYELDIDVDHVMRTVHPMSPSVAAGIVIFQYGWVKYFNDTKFVNLARALGPSYFRVGGTKEDVVYFDPQAGNYPDLKLRSASQCLTQHRNQTDFEQHKRWAEKMLALNLKEKQFFGVEKVFKPVPLSPSEWIELNNFCECVNWKLIYGLSIQFRDGEKWNSSNAQLLLKYTENKFKVDWELGNEPNSYHHKGETALTAEQIAEGFTQLKSLLSASQWWNNSEIYGPDINNIGMKSTGRYLSAFLQNAKDAINGMTFHQYYLNGHTAAEGDFLKPKNLNKIIKQLRQVVGITHKIAPNKEIVLGETASAYGGGAPGLSNSYLDGFTWFDKLGMSAKSGVDLVVRQTLYSGNYALLDNNFDPMPDYWLTLLYKKIVGPEVLKVSLRKCSQNICKHKVNGYLRIYAHCTKHKSRSGYARGSIVVYFINLASRNMRIKFEPFQNPKTKGELYLLEPVGGNLTATSTELNGKILKLENDNTIPPLKPRKISPGYLSRKGLKVPSLRYGFLVLKNLGAKACLSS